MFHIFLTTVQLIPNTSSTYLFNIIIVLAAVAISVFYVWLLNREKILSILLATYISYGLVEVFPYTPWLGSLSLKQLILFKLLLFIAGVILFSLVFILTKTIKKEAGGFFLLRWLRSVLFAFSQLGLLVSIIMVLAPADWLSKVSFSIQQIFVSPKARFIWFIIPLVILIITKHPQRRGPGRPALG